MATTSKDSGGWLVEHTIAAAGEKTITFKTENTFMDANARVTITTPNAGAISLTANNSSTALTMGSASNGTYSPTATITGTITPSSAGWLGVDNYNVSDTDVTVGTINQSTLKNGTTTISSGTTITPNSSSQTINISEGYNAARTVIIGTQESGQKATVTSGSASISSLTIAYNTNADNYTVTGSANVSAPTIETAGFVSSTAGTKNANNGGATVSTTLTPVGLGAALSAQSLKKTPSIAKHSDTNISSAGTVTTTKPSSGYYIAVKSDENSDWVQATPTILTVGYCDGIEGHYVSTPSESKLYGANASATTYIPLTQATFANAATSGTTYTDISSTGPILVSGSYLFINEGYTPATKISLARLVPDASGTNAAAQYIVSGYTAFDNDGTLIVGTMQIYDGTYTIT